MVNSKGLTSDGSGSEAGKKVKERVNGRDSTE